MSPKKLMTFLLPFYIALGPVYWFLFVSPGIFNAVKYAMAGLLIGSTLFFGSKEWIADKRFLADSGVKLIVLIIFLSLPGMYFSQSDASLGILVRYVILLGVLVALYWLSNEATILQRLPKMIVLVMVPLCSITVADWLLGLNFLSHDGYQRLHAVGFSTTRTGWSSGLACFSVFMVWRYLETQSRWRYAFILCAVLVVLSQLASGGRGGLLASLLGSFALLVYYRQYQTIFTGFVLAVLLAFSMQDELAKHLRFDRIGDSSQQVDFTSGRAEQYGLAFDLIESPADLLIGLGPKGYEKAFEKIGIHFEIHNVWLRLFVEYGLLLPVLIIGFIVLSALQYLRRSRGVVGRASPLIILGSGMLTTVVEPNAIVFSYQNYLLWWWLFVSMKADAFKKVT